MTEKIQSSSSWNFKPLGTQISRIAKLEMALHIPEGFYPETRIAARNRIHWLRAQLKVRNKPASE